MLRFSVRRLANMLFVLIAISIITFVIFNVIPGGDPALRIAGRSSNEQTRAQVREDFGFDDPVYAQYLRLMKQTADGDMVSYSNQTNVREEIIRGIPATASLVIGAAVIWVFFGILFGVLSAIYAGRFVDTALTILAMIGISLPIFWVGALLLYYLTFKVELFPAGGYVGRHGLGRVAR
jgi:peptide/nickel transport system permease protein